MSFTSKIPNGQPEKESKPKINIPKYIPEEQIKRIQDKPAFNPNAKSKNKIEPYTNPLKNKPKS